MAKKRIIQPNIPTKYPNDATAINLRSGALPSIQSNDQVDLLLMAHPGEPMDDLAKKLGTMGVSVGRMIKNGGILGVSAPLALIDELQAMPEIDQIRRSEAISLPPMLDNIPQ